MKKVFIAGGVSYDHIVHVDEFFEAKAQTVFSSKSYYSIGGTGAGKALNLCRLGFSTFFHGLIGNDSPGWDIINIFDKTPYLSFLHDIDSVSTETHTNFMDKKGARISVYTTYKTFEPEVDYSKYERYIDDCDFIVINIINYTRNFIPYIKKSNKKIWCDIHDYDGKNEYHQDFIDAADYIFMSSEQLEDDYRDEMKKFMEMGKEFVICTHGKDGATALDKSGKFIEVPIVDEYKRKDTNGAGDSFFAGVLYGYSKGYDLEKCMKFGSIIGGLTVMSEKLYHEKLNTDFIEKEYQRLFEVE